jgi:hypothetical protein
MVVMHACEREPYVCRADDCLYARIHPQIPVRTRSRVTNSFQEIIAGFQGIPWRAIFENQSISTRSSDKIGTQNSDWAVAEFY